jgi:hypothetical protein
MSLAKQFSPQGPKHSTDKQQRVITLKIVKDERGKLKIVEQR